MIQIKENKACCGCSACVQRCPGQCISMLEDCEGFLYPVIDKGRCIDCGLCEKVCPVINQGHTRKPLQVYAAKNKNEEIRRQSSSGGIFTLLAEQILSVGGVVFGARFNAGWEVVHDYTESVEGLTVFRGSKYVQSRVGDTYKQAEEFLKEDRKVLFSGTPCQIAGLKLYLGREYDNLLTVDFICHGVPSPGVWRKYLKEIAARRAAGKNTVLSASLNTSDDVLQNISSISFRDKVLGWKKYSFVVCLSATDGAEKNSVLLSETLDKNLFMRGFLADLYLRPSCHACPVKSLKCCSDITLGDFWGIQSVMPELDDNRGISAVIVNSEKGKEHLHDIKAELHEVSYIDLCRKNKALTFSAILPEKRVTFFAKDGKSFHEKIHLLCRISTKRRVKAIFTQIVNRVLKKKNKHFIKHLLDIKVET